MSQKYYLPCPACGKKHIVDVTRLGVPFACDACQKANLEVASLRELRQLDPVDDGSAKPETPWGPRQGLQLLGGVIFLAAAFWAAFIYSGIHRHEMRTIKGDSVAQSVQDLSLIQTLEQWRILKNNPIESYAYQLEEQQEMAALHYKLQIQSLQTWSAVFAGVAFVGLVLHIIGWTIPPGDTPSLGAPRRRKAASNA